jgi:succinate dehydrogenase / fumarate reductase, cytochrome b subunit
LSASATPVPLADTRANPHTPVLRKLFSLSGVFPIGVFLMEHLWVNAKALRGEEAFTQGVADIQSLPYLPFLEIVGIFIPLGFHALYGVYLSFTAKTDAREAGYGPSWLYPLLRASGLVALVFIGFHLYEYRIHKWLFGMRTDTFYPTIAAHLSSTSASVPWLALVYLLGILATTFHFAYGLLRFLLTWGFAVTRAAQRRAAYACAGLGALLFLVGADTLIVFATGSRLYAPSDLGGKVQPSVCPPASSPVPAAAASK